MVHFKKYTVILVDDSTKPASTASRLKLFTLMLARFQDTRIQIFGPRFEIIYDLLYAEFT